MSAQPNPPSPLVLASTSPFRRALLERLGLEFQVMAPDADESARPGEIPQDLVMRLAEAKARAVAPAFPRGLIIGSDQVAYCDGRILTKPGGREAAIAQLEASAARRVSFFTGLCLLDAGADRVWVEMVPFHVQFRPLSRAQIEAYLDREQPWNCAGSFKSEGLGVALFQRMEGEDPSALIGLPLIRLVSLLAEAGVEVLAPVSAA